MKHRILLLLCSGLLSGLWFTACGGDDEPVTPAPPQQEEPKPEPEPDPTPPAPTDCQVSIAVDWSLFGEAPSAMTAVFYPADTTAAPITHVVQRADSVKATLTPGKYDVLLFNDSTAHFTTIGFRGMDKFDTAELYLLPQKAARSGEEPPLIITGELEPIGIAILQGYEVTEAMLTSAPDDKLKHLHFQPYTIDAVTSISLEVNNIERVSSVLGAISGMAETYHISTGKTGASKVTHSLADWLIETDPDNPGSGWFRTHFASFGLPYHVAAEPSQEDVQLSVSILVEGVEQPVEHAFAVGHLFQEKEEGGDTPGGDEPGGDLEVDFHVEVDVPIVIPNPDQGGEGEGGENPDQGGEGEGGEDPDQPGEGGEGEGGEDPDQPGGGGGGGGTIIPQPDPVTISVNQLTWGGTSTTLASGEVGLFFTTSGTTDASYTAVNRRVSGNSGYWTADGPMLYWLDNSTSVTYSAYAPYNNSAATDGSISTDYPVSVPAVQTAAGQAAADFCYAAPVTTTFAEAGGNIALNLQHRLAQFSVNLTLASEFADAQEVTFTQVTLSPCAVQCGFNLSTGNWNDLSADAAKETVTLSDAGSRTFLALLVPQTLTGYTLTVEASIDGQARTYTFTAPSDLTLTQGAANTLSLTVGQERIELNKVSVSDWTEGDKLGDNDENEAEEVI